MRRRHLPLLVAALVAGSVAYGLAVTVAPVLAYRVVSYWVPALAGLGAGGWAWLPARPGLPVPMEDHPQRS